MAKKVEIEQKEIAAQGSVSVAEMNGGKSIGI